MVWADKEGNIGWQSVGIAPIRTNFSGLVPVPGDGRYEWEGYLPIIEKPHTLNPPEGYFATANQNVTPADYEHWNAIGFSWADPFRGDRVEEVLSAGNQLNMDDMKALQVDYHSNPASKLVPMILELPFTGQSAAAADKLRDWDYELGPKSIEAAIYVAFENEISSLAKSRFIPPSAVGMISSIQMSRIMEWINEPDNRFGPNPIQGRDQFLSDAFNQGVMFLNENLGEDMDTWQYGQQKLKHTYMAHALSEIVNEEIKAKIDIGPLPRGGNSYTPGSSGGNMRQSSGASFRMIVNTGDWDAAVATNGPGQSGNPQSPFYKNLFEPWANDQYFPVYYSRSKIESAAANRTLLKPTK
ncbi:MAG: penicillin amidase [Paraglaciecola sp.]|jgi:penicillin amidase